MGYQTQALPFLFWDGGLFLPMGTEDFRKFLRASYFFKYFFPLSSNAIIKQCNTHIYSISNLGYHTIIYKYYITLYISILVFWGYWPKKSLRSPVAQVGWGLCHYRSLAAKPRHRCSYPQHSDPPPLPQGIPIGKRWIYLGRFTDGDSRRVGGGVTVKDTSACWRGREMLYFDTSLCSHQSPPYLLYII